MRYAICHFLRRLSSKSNQEDVFWQDALHITQVFHFSCNSESFSASSPCNYKIPVFINDDGRFLLIVKGFSVNVRKQTSMSYLLTLNKLSVALFNSGAQVLVA